MTEDDLQVAALARAVKSRAASASIIPAAPALKVPSNQPRPVYDEATDGNRFAWILRVAKQVRTQEMAANELRRIRLQAARRYAMPVLVAGSDTK